MTPVLLVRDLVVQYQTAEGTATAVDGCSLDVRPGEVVAVVGESGCGKSTLALAVLGLLPDDGRVVRGEIRLAGQDLRAASARQMRDLRGREMAMVFQDPATSLHPLLPVARQVAEAVRVHEPELPADVAQRRAAELLESVGIPAAGSRGRSYPHQWSGGMRQRAMIAMAIANRPRLLVADEPTSALDVTVQAQVLDVLRTAHTETGAGLLLITHDLGVVAEMADRVVVMYAGRVVETAPVAELFCSPRHPYTLALLTNVPRPDVDRRRLAPIPGQPPDPLAVPSGCAFHPRCRLRHGRRRCCTDKPALEPTTGPDHLAACHFWPEMAREAATLADELGVELSGGQV